MGIEAGEESFSAGKYYCCWGVLIMYRMRSYLPFTCPQGRQESSPGSGKKVVGRMYALRE